MSNEALQLLQQLLDPPPAEHDPRLWESLMADVDQGKAHE